uniref:fatty acid 2-hydroxylase-like n=1 Tax=Styela clava TaxID=7725 RepID=UPI0019398FA9|nr:fatty acid 2-hydroxylase-like [Styela clava]
MPQFTKEDFEKISSDKQTLVIRNKKVYDISKFVSIHPGGSDVITKRHGKDVTTIMEKGTHKHSENAYRWLEQHYVGDLVDEKTEEVDKQAPSSDIVNWSKPVLWQVGHLGEKYHDWVDSPVDKSLRLFKSDFVEYFSSTSWYVIPIVWIPVILLLLLTTYWNYTEILFFPNVQSLTFSCSIHVLPFAYIGGIFMWTFLEYALHRWLFHASPPVSSYWLITLHFLLHGQHHKVPFDKGRLVFPPVPASILGGMLYIILSGILPIPIRHTLLAGVLTGYVVYDLTHYYLHYGNPSKGSYFYNLRAYHVRHHFQSPELGFGISSRLWDYPFNTLIGKNKKAD